MHDITPIKKSDQSYVTDQVFKALKTKLESMEWLPGDRLPSENYLAESFGVSRMSVRTALQKLSALGMVETKNGGGTYIKKFDLSKMIDHVSGIMANNITYEDISTFRNVVEITSFNLLRGKKINTQDITVLEKYCSRMEKAAQQKNLVNFSKEDYEFHFQICKMGGNGLFIYSYEMSKMIIIEYFKKHYDPRVFNKETGYIHGPDYDYYSNCISRHHAIIEALKNADIDECIRLTNQLTAHG